MHRYSNIVLLFSILYIKYYNKIVFYYCWYNRIFFVKYFLLKSNIIKGNVSNSDLVKYILK